MAAWIAITGSALLAWLYLAVFHGRFWQADQRLNRNKVNPDNAPRITAVIPARNEAETIAETVRALLDQDYPQPFPIVVVDDGSDDGTAHAARAAATTDAEAARIIVIAGTALPDGWTGKMWAVKQGIEAAPESDYLLLTDADIDHVETSLGSLVAHAETTGCRLVSLMVKLHCGTFWERMLIPAFVYFFQKLYPFPWVNDPDRKEAAAAGGCMLVHRQTLIDAGGIEAIHDAVIDDCALAALIKPFGPIWLGLAEETASTRVYDELSPIWRMVARTAYVQLDHDPVRLIGTVLGMVWLYLLPVLAFAIGGLLCQMPLVVVGGAALVVMMWTYLPTLALYRVSPLWALSLPVAGALYTLMTADSARRHYARAGDQWKGRRYGT